MRSVEKAGLIDLNIQVNEGPSVRFLYEGYTPPKKARGQILGAWQSGFIDQRRISSAVEAIRRNLFQEGFLDSRVKGNVIEATDSVKRVLFDTDKGPRYRLQPVVLEGVSLKHLDNLEILLRENKLEQEAYSDPRRIVDLFSRYYLTRGYLSAKVNWPRVERDIAKKESRAVIGVQEGPEFRVEALQFRGQQAMEEARLREGLPLKQGSLFSSAQLDATLQTLEDRYGDAGYPRAQIEPVVQLDEARGTVDLAFQIDEKTKAMIESVEIAGTDQTSEQFVRSQLSFAAGEPLSRQKTTDSVRGLYKTGAFRRVEIQPQPLSTTLDSDLPQAPVQMAVSVEEPKPYRFQYGGSYDTGTGPGVIVQLENRNSLGGARTIGTRGSWERDKQELRLYLTQPPLRRLPLSSTATVYFKQQDYQKTARVDTLGFSLQQETSLGRTLRLSYGYKMEKQRLAYIGKSQVESVRQAPLTASLTRDLRDDFLDARQGSFSSNSLEFAPSWLGSDYAYIRYFGQYAHYFPLIRPKPDPFGLKIRRSPLVFATQVRLGLLEGLTREDVVLTDRFYAGGGTSIRGFEQDSLGPIDATGTPIGGNALFILNNEIRFPLASLFEGVGFLDVGNVYQHISDFDLTDLRKSAGFGLRVKTPFVLLRFDFGFPLDLRPGERRQMFFFSIGQAF